MSDILSLSTRPTRLSDLYGQKNTVDAIRKHMASRKPRTWLFEGPPGVGKTTIAKIIAVSLNCDHMKLWGDPCKACSDNWQQFAIHDINAAKVAGVEELESVADLSMRKPMTGSTRVIILDECQNISKTAWTMLLKPTEEPPPFTTWILLTSEPKKIPEANLRRPVKYRLKALVEEDVEKYVQHWAKETGITRDLKPLFESLHSLKINSPGVVLQALEKYSAGVSASEATAGVDGSSTDIYNFCKAVVTGNMPRVKEMLIKLPPEEVRWVRAVLAGWVRNSLLKQGKGEKAANSLIELANMPFDEAMAYNWFCGVVYKITVRYGK